MNKSFARALVALSLVALPVTASASTKTAATHHHGTAKKEPSSKKKDKHHGHKGTPAKGLTATATRTKAP